MPSLTILGSGEAFDPYLPNTSLLYQGPTKVLIDCGFSSVQSLWRHSPDPDFLDAVLLTHHHADHTFGMPSLLLVMQFQGRRRALSVIGPPGTGEYLATLFDLAYAPGMARVSFPVEVVECNPGDPTGLGSLTIRTALPDHGIAVLSTRFEVDGRTQFAYSADGKITAATRELFRGAPVLVHECYALPGQEGAVHSHVEAVLQVAAESGASTLILAHQAAGQRKAIADYVDRQRIYGGQVLMPDGPMAVNLGGG